uniref:ribosomal protein L21 n=1 Tax=Pulvinaster venetus TaxID=427767 RepID=UPI001FCDE835|nr:ribosomal protein L21 [Pulvinaster venetus]UNJ17051.1 ribosomal protein L21 [Pulvinaster venetus]
MNYAIIQTSGKQLWVEPGRFYDVNRLPANPGDTIILNRVLLVNNHGEINIGQPCLPNVSIKATVLRHLRGPKIVVYKMKPKKGFRNKKGHRQELTRLMIDQININQS